MYDVTERYDGDAAEVICRSRAVDNRCLLVPKPHGGPEKEALNGPAGYIRSHHADRDGFLGVEDAQPAGRRCAKHAPC